MEKLADIAAFKEHQNIVLDGYDPVTQSGFTQVPNLLLNNPDLSFAAKTVYAKLLSYAWNNNRVFPGQDRLASDLGTSQATVARAIRELSSEAWLEIKRRGQGKTNIYVLKYKVNVARG